MNIQEVWVPIKGFETSYEISNFGSIRSLKNYIIRKPSKQKTGYLQITLFLKGKSYYRYVHRLVAEHFVENKENKLVVNHKDGNKLNNHSCNLEWCTDAENNKHAGTLNLKPIGTKHTNSNFSKDDLEKIKKLKNEGLSHRKIAKILNVHKTSITNFLSGKTYIKEYINE